MQIICGWEDKNNPNTINNPPDILLNVCVLSPDMGTLAAV